MLSDVVFWDPVCLVPTSSIERLTEFLFRVGHSYMREVIEHGMTAPMSGAIDLRGQDELRFPSGSFGLADTDDTREPSWSPASDLIAPQIRPICELCRNYGIP